MKTPIDFWWDFEGDYVIVECSDINYPVLAKFPIPEIPKDLKLKIDATENFIEKQNLYKGYTAEKQIAQADNLIADFKSGRISYIKYIQPLEN